MAQKAVTFFESSLCSVDLNSIISQSPGVGFGYDWGLSNCYKGIYREQSSSFFFEKQKARKS